VGNALLQWIQDIIANYSIDGLRVDTVPEVTKSFWQKFATAAGVYSVGEVYNGDVGYVASYQSPQGPLPGVLSYPLYFTLINVFASQQSMYNLQSINQAYQASFSNPNLLGNFIDNHDHPRFLNMQPDTQLYKSALAYTLLSTGIPIIYYGSEQGFHGSADPNNREPLWTSNYNEQSELYLFIAQLVAFRKDVEIWQFPQVQRYADDNFYAFTRGTTFVALTNGGQHQPSVQITITYHPYNNGEKLCNIFYPTDCFVVQNNQFQITLLNGELKVYCPVS